jgi:hypothetical protein
MKEVEASVREDDRPSGPPLFGEYLPQLGTTQDASHVAKCSLPGFGWRGISDSVRLLIDSASA